MASSGDENHGHGPLSADLESQPVPLPESDDLTKPGVAPPVPEKPRRLRSRTR